MIETGGPREGRQGKIPLRLSDRKNLLLFIHCGLNNYLTKNQTKILLTQTALIVLH